MEKKIYNAIEEPLREIEITLIDAVFLKEDNHTFLRITIDNTKGIDIDDCVKATKLINPIIDKLDIKVEDYILEVTSKEKGDIDE